MAKKAEYTHIAILRFSALGDVAMMVPILLAVTKKYPQLHLTIVSREFHRPLFEGIQQVEFYRAELSAVHKGFLGLRRLYKELKSQKIDAVADLHNVLRSNILKFFFGFDGMPFVQIDKGRAEKTALTRKNDKNFQQLKTTHQRYADVFSKLGYPVELHDKCVLKQIPLSENVLLITGSDTKKWIGIAPFAAHQGKMYPFLKISKVVQELSKTERYKIFLFGGGKSEQEQLNILVGTNSNVINIAGKLSFAEELQLISNLDLMVSMDSANGHLATNYGIPVITLWGVTHPFAGFYPFGQPMENALLSDREKFPMIPTSIYGNKVPKGYENVMETITKDDVLTKIESVLKN